MKGTSEEGTERGIDGTRERGMEEASRGGIERGREGAWEQGKEGNFKGDSIFTNKPFTNRPLPLRLWYSSTCLQQTPLVPSQSVPTLQVEPNL